MLIKSFEHWEASISIKCTFHLVFLEGMTLCHLSMYLLVCITDESVLGV